MSTQTITKKRKSADGSTSAAKKVKVAKSAEKPAPVKSALKKPAVETTEVKTKKKSKPVIEAHEVKASKPAAKATKPAKNTEKKDKFIIEDKDDEDEDGGSGMTLTADQTASLLAGFSSESEDDGEADGEGIPTSKPPKAPTTGDIQDRIASATKASKKNDSSNDPERTPGVIYIGRIPRGFHEPQMRAYFSQFGTITHLKLARNRKTGASKHFAFLEFASSAVADIVAKTMDKYLLFGHILQVRRVDAEQMGEGLWKGEGRRGRNVRPNNKLEGGSLRRRRTREEWEGRVKREERKRTAKGEKMREMGYEFEMPMVKGVDEVPVKAKAGEFAVAEAENVAAGREDAPAAVAEAPEELIQAERTVGQDDEGAAVVTEKKKTKKRAADGKPKVKEAKKVVKKVKA